MAKDSTKIRSEWSVADGPDKVAASSPQVLAPGPANLNAPRPPNIWSRGPPKPKKHWTSASYTR
jgi:hypothetical protein